MEILSVEGVKFLLSTSIEKCKQGIEVFSDASIRIYRYTKGFDLPMPFSKAIKDIHVQATNSIAEHFTPEQLKAWQSGNVESFASLVKKCHASYLVFDSQEEIIGYALLWNAGLLIHLYIHPSHQFNGYGKALLDIIELDLTNRNKSGVLCLKGNIGSCAFYLKRGYSITGKEIIDMGGVPIAVQVMEKSLSIKA
ncbi:N-acetyltransferase family protein [Psychroserpens sp.]